MPMARIPCRARFARAGAKPLKGAKKTLRSAGFALTGAGLQLECPVERADAQVFLAYLFPDFPFITVFP